MIKNKIKFHGKVDPKKYVDERIKKWATKMRQNPEMIKQLSDGYTEWMQSKFCLHFTCSVSFCYSFLPFNFHLINKYNI